MIARRKTVIVTIVALALSTTPVRASDQDIYSEINVLGDLSILVSSTKVGPACANFWWVKRLLGSVQQVGQKCGFFTLEVPSFLGISLASKLRASAGPGIIIRVTGSQEHVAKSIKF